MSDSGPDSIPVVQRICSLPLSEVADVESLAPHPGHQMSSKVISTIFR